MRAFEADQTDAESLEALLDRCERVCVTKVYASADADSFFPCLDSSPDWRIEHESEMLEENGLKFQFVDYVRN